MKESQIEKSLAARIKARGGMCYKFVSPGNVGVPDRIIILPDGRTVFVELKAKTGELTEMQKWQIGRMRRCGADVRICKGIDAVIDLVAELFPGSGRKVNPA